MLSKKQLDSYWMPFTANRDYKDAPLLLVCITAINKGARY